MIKNALSIDIEDWYQGILQIDSRDWPEYENRLSYGTSRILEILSAYKIKATFFILGYIGETNPGLVKEIAQSGHEIASHGYYHRPIYLQTPQEFRKDASESKDILESITGTAVKGYRAPFFSINKDCLWALDILKELGFSYDSSIFPTKNFLYGIPDAPQTIYRTDKSDIVEFPLSVLKIVGFNLPICGGFYLRSLPYSISKFGISHFNRKGWPVIVYMHPWEIDTRKPKINMPLKWKIIREYNIDKMERKFKMLVKDFYFTTVSEVLNGR